MAYKQTRIATIKNSSITSSNESEDAKVANADEVEEIEERWRNIVERAYNLAVTKTRSDLSVYWELGEIIVNLRDEGKVKYGGHTVEELASIINLSQQTVRGAEQFRRRFTEEQYKQVLEADPPIPWRVVYALASVPDKAKRDKFIEAALAGNLSFEDIRALKKGETVALDEDSAAKALRKITSSMETLKNRLSSFQLEYLQRIHEDQDSYDELFESFLNTLVELSQQIAELEEQLQ